MNWDLKQEQRAKKAKSERRVRFFCQDVMMLSITHPCLLSPFITYSTFLFSLSIQRSNINNMGGESSGTTIIGLEGLEDAETDRELEFSAPYLHSERLSATQAQYRRGETDTGSPEYQVATMTERISYLTSHLQTHPKDFSTRRGLVALVNKRRRLLNYLFNEDISRYQDIIKSLGVRHRAPGRVMTREEKYAKFSGRRKK